MFQIAADPVPLEKWDDGSVRVAGTRIHYYVVLEGYLNGDTPEDLVEAFPDLSVGTVYTLIGYYHAHQKQISGWLEQIERETEQIWDRLEEASPSQESRRRLKARLDERRAQAAQ